MSRPCDPPPHTHRYELLKEERSDVELEFQDKLKHMEEKYQHDMQQLESMFQSHIMEQVEAYQKLVKVNQPKPNQPSNNQTASSLSINSGFFHGLYFT